MSTTPLEVLDQTIVPFGAHKGKNLDSTPLRYLDWLMSSEAFCNGLYPDFFKLLAEYLSHPVIAKELQTELEEDE